MRLHTHYCTRCRAKLYVCCETPLIDDCGRHCPNDSEDGEFCEECCAQLRAEQDEAERLDLQQAYEHEQAQRAAGVTK